MGSNANLNQANRAKKDEFYTQLSDIETELKHYRDHFKGKVVLCNCDDPFESNFFKYFCLNFNRLGLRKLIATCYSGSPITGNELTLFGDETEEEKRTPYKAVVTSVYDANGDGATSMVDVAQLFKQGENRCERLKGNGDFRSRECLQLLDEADIVVTNPPFSLFREYVGTLMEHHKKFIIIGNVNAISYKETFPYLQKNKMWIGSSIHSGDRKFNVPDDYPLSGATCGVDDEGRKFIRVKGVRWYTNLDFKSRHEEMILVKRYNPDDYPKYVNFDAIEVSKTADIPCDYDGKMGVPITFMDKFNADQFEIVGISNHDAHPIKPLVEQDAKYSQGGPAFYIKTGDREYRRIFGRIIIRNLHPEPQRYKEG